MGRFFVNRTWVRTCFSPASVYCLAALVFGCDGGEQGQSPEERRLRKVAAACGDAGVSECGWTIGDYEGLRPLCLCRGSR